MLEANPKMKLFAFISGLAFFKKPVTVPRTRGRPKLTFYLDPVERLYSFINHCVHNKWPFCQKWNFQIEPIIGYATKFFEKYNSTSWYHGIRSSSTGYPSVWYDDFVNVSCRIFTSRDQLIMLSYYDDHVSKMYGMIM